MRVLRGVSRGYNGVNTSCCQFSWAQMTPECSSWDGIQHNGEEQEAVGDDWIQLDPDHRRTHLAVINSVRREICGCVVENEGMTVAVMVKSEGNDAGESKRSAGRSG